MMANSSQRTLMPKRFKQQTGLVLLVSLIVLVIMTLAAIALVRSMMSSNQIANNLALRQGTTAAADVAMEKARFWLIDRSIVAPAELNSASNDHGYSPSNSLNPINGKQWSANVNWVWANPNAGNTALPQAKASEALNANGYRAAYFIQRSCATEGQKTPNRSGCDLQKMSSNAQEGSSEYQMIYKITVRIEGPKNTVSFYQATLF